MSSRPLRDSEAARPIAPYDENRIPAVFFGGESVRMNWAEEDLELPNPILLGDELSRESERLGGALTY